MLSPERQSARMSKITNDGLTRSGTRCFIAVSHMATVVFKGIINLVSGEDVSCTGITGIHRSPAELRSGTVD